MVNTLVAYQGNQSLKCPLVTSSQFQSHAWWWTRFQLQLNARTVTWMSCQHSFSCYMHNNPTTASTEDLLELFIWICFSKIFPAVYDLFHFSRYSLNYIVIFFLPLLSITAEPAPILPLSKKSNCFLSIAFVSRVFAQEYTCVLFENVLN